MENINRERRLGEINAESVMKIQLGLSYAKQRNNPHPAEKDIESGHPSVSDIFKTVQSRI